MSEFIASLECIVSYTNYICTSHIFFNIFVYFYEMLSYIQCTIIPVVGVIVVCRAFEYSPTYTSHTIRYRDIRETSATVERLKSYARYAIRYYDARETAAIMECILSYARYAIRYRDARKTATTRKCLLAYACHTIRNDYIASTFNLVNFVLTSVYIKRQSNRFFFPNIRYKPVFSVNLCKPKSIRSIDEFKISRSCFVSFVSIFINN